MEISSYLRGGIFGNCVGNPVVRIDMFFFFLLSFVVTSHGKKEGSTNHVHFQRYFKFELPIPGR